MPLNLTTLPLVPIVVATGGAAFVMVGASLHERARAIARWPAVRGRITAACVLEEPSRSGDGPRTMLYRPEIQFEYQVAGRSYAGQRVHALRERAISRRRYADDVVARYPVGREVQVYYDPANPRDAALERTGTTAWALGMMLLGGGLAIGALGWAVRGAFA